MVLVPKRRDFKPSKLDLNDLHAENMGFARHFWVFLFEIVAIFFEKRPK